MAGNGKIFYRTRIKSRDGEKKPRYRITAVANLDLKVYADHLRQSELEQLAELLGAELVELHRGPKHVVAEEQ